MIVRTVHLFLKKTYSKSDGRAITGFGFGRQDCNYSTISTRPPYPQV